MGKGLKAGKKPKTNAYKKDELLEQSLNDNAACLSTAFALVLSEDYDFDQDQIRRVLARVEGLVSLIGTSKYPSISSFKIDCALAHGVDIGLDEKEQKRVDELYNATWNDIPSDNYDIEVLSHIKKEITI